MILRMTVLLVIAIVIGMIQETSGQEPAYVGAAQCKFCHFKQHAIWEKSKHAKAFEDLKPKEQKDPRCLTCHATGYRSTQEVKPEIVGVQCEACHGPGSLFIKIHPKRDKKGALKAGMIAKPESALCLSCHNEQSPYFKGFKYEEMWKKIEHSK